MRMGGFSWLHPAADAAGDPHSRSLCRAKPVYSGLICWRYWATAEHGVAQSQPSGLRWLLITCSRIPVLSGQGLRDPILLPEHYEDLVFAADDTPLRFQ